MSDENYNDLLVEASKNAKEFGMKIGELLTAITAFSKTNCEYKLEDVGGLLVESIIELQKLQVQVKSVDDEKHTIGVALNEIEQKLHIVSNLLEKEG